MATKVDAFVYNTIAQWYNEDQAAAGSNQTLPEAPSGQQPPPADTSAQTFLGVNASWSNPVFVAVGTFRRFLRCPPCHPYQPSAASLLVMGARRRCEGCNRVCSSRDSGPLSSVQSYGELVSPFVGAVSYEPEDRRCDVFCRSWWRCAQLACSCWWAWDSCCPGRAAEGALGLRCASLLACTAWDVSQFRPVQSKHSSVHLEGAAG